MSMLKVIVTQVTKLNPHTSFENAFFNSRAKVEGYGSSSTSSLRDSVELFCVPISFATTQTAEQHQEP